MKIDDLATKWDSVPPSEAYYQRIDADHILDIFVGKDSKSQKELMVVTEIEPSKINSSKSLSIQKGLRKDGRWATTIQLIKNDEEEVFTHLCWDLIEHSRKATSKSLAFEIFITRLFKWQKLLESGNALLSEEVIHGIIGELLFATKYLQLSMNWDDIFNAWLGPDGANKDFVFFKTWAEVKTIPPGKTYITISSLEQLDSKNDGLLAVVGLEATSGSDAEGFSFSSIIQNMRISLATCPNALLDYESKLLELGYSECREYSNKYYKYCGMNIYTVTVGFPRLTRNDCPHQITGARYDILLPEISAFELEVQ
ncbi:MAG: PD-(D/E)XK motif protein [Dehalococcoides mccartyi]|uniref:PD-(D/E)XK motif protein n=1 Tax=Dehalococcoides mccartyi TaxID=61435 RepID=UPI0030F97FEC